MAPPTSFQSELSEFVYDLLNNTVDAILNARIDQERRYFELIEDTLLSAEEFIEKYDLRQEVGNQFSDGNLPPSELESLLQDIYTERIRSIGKLLEDGPPKLRVEKGNLKIKLVFNVEGPSEAQQENERALSRFRQEAANTGFNPTRDTSALAPLDSIKQQKLKSTVQLRMDEIIQRKQIYRHQQRKLKIRLPSQNNTTDDKDVFSEINIQFTIE